MRYDLAGYASRYKDFQVFQFVDLGAGATSILLKNAARAESRGVDAGFAWRANSQLDIGIQLSWNRAVFRQFDNCSTTVSCTGNRLPYAPKFSSALTTKYVLESERYIEECFDREPRENRLYNIRNAIDHGDIDADNLQEILRVAGRLHQLWMIVFRMVGMFLPYRPPADSGPRDW